ncbi:hypothetical protein T484DRAFT_1929184 [Baffinella frigidus]|nr:hypothetical protein T484DRAFT_1929184 [Cryptophyta sp. CCMP2293]
MGSPAPGMRGSPMGSPAARGSPIGSVRPGQGSPGAGAARPRHVFSRQLRKVA